MFELKPIKKPNTQQAIKPAGKAHKIFSMDDDEEAPALSSSIKKGSSGVQNLQIAAELSKTTYAKMLDETSKYILEDPTIFDYDGHYDQYTEKRKELEQQKKQKVESKHINSLVKSSERRKVEQSMIYEKMAEKEMQRDAQTAPTEKYVTASYKKLMSDTQKFLEEDNAKEEYNKKHTAENKDNILGLYKDMYKNDMFAGGYRPDLESLLKQPQKPAAQEAPNNPPETQDKPQAFAAPAQKPQNVDSIQTQKQTTGDKKETITLKQSEQVDPSKNEEQAHKDKSDKYAKRHASKSRSRSRSKSPARVRAEVKEPEAPKESKEDKLKSAKERYMQRKLNQNNDAAAANPTTDQPQMQN